MSFLKELSQRALQDDYFKQLFLNAELSIAYSYFGLERRVLEDKHFLDLLRFADILSRSDIPDAKNKAYKVISLLIDDYKDDSLFRTFATSILVKLGNFPAINFIEQYRHDSDKHSLELIFERFVKEVFQNLPESNLTLTDDQYVVFEKLKENNHYSFSGPTSLGKSFILNAFIKDLIVQNKITENIIILVPTRALINQNLIHFKREFENKSDYKVLSHPTIPEAFREHNQRYIFVFTPERLISYLADGNNPKVGYLFVDEAQKILSDNDSRGPLYYHAVLQAARKSIKLFFASPNIPNPEVFLKLFEKSEDESISIKSSPVSQNRYYLDLVDKECKLFSDIGREESIPLDYTNSNFDFWLKKLSNGHSSIIYCNTRVDTINYALDFAKQLPDKSDERINEVIAVIKDHLHEKYYLIDCLKKGVAFHFGSLPQRIRIKVEALFLDKVIDFLFCTSTLLEGVNLPAKNIFILSNAIGLTKFSDIDFWNLAGRAGRLSKELSGNIVCARVENKGNRWDNPAKDLEVVKLKEIKPLSPALMSGRKNFFKNLECALANTEFTNKSASANQKEIWKHYANIALIHEIRSDDSVLRLNFLSYSDKAKNLLQQKRKENIVPERILSAYSMIGAEHQNKVYGFNNLSEKVLPLDTSYESVLDYLKLLSDFYSWDTEESLGKSPMYKSPESLKYYAVLMSNWMDSTPLNRMISSSIDYFKRKGEIWDVDQMVSFNPSNQYQINLVINGLITDVDNILRFKLKNYFGNYYEVLVDKYGETRAGENWAEFLEYGTKDTRIIDLQNLGIPRHLATYLLKNYPDQFVFNEGHLVSFNKDSLLSSLDRNSIEYRELHECI